LTTGTDGKSGMLQKRFITELHRTLGDDGVLTAPEVLQVYSYDGQTNRTHMPDVVLLPKNTQEVAEIVKFANREKIPVTPRGGGTNLSGGSVPIMGGIVLVLTKMDKVLNVDKENLSATAQSGIILQNLTVRLARDGLFFPPDPQSFLGATVGGAISENAGGPSCVKYGVTKQYVLGLEVVLPTGEIVRLGGRTLKNAVGYDLLHLFISAEGTLGVVTTAELKLRPIPPARKTIMVVYDSVEKAGESVAKIFENSVIPCKIELMDNWLINSIEDMMHLGLPRDADAVLLFETDGMAEAVEKETEKIEEIVRKYGAVQVRVARSVEEANQYWTARKAGYAAVTSRARNIVSEDATVPIGKIPALIRKCREMARTYDLDIIVLGHAGDGNLHPCILSDDRDKDLWERTNRAMDEILATAMELGGVVSGEHGIGLEKIKYMKKSLEPVALELMKKIKKVLDPNGIMNPGKIWEWE
jgi:glycolate oxidase